MTREEREIIEAIKDMGYDRTAYPREKVSAVIDMAIEALTNEWTLITVSEPNTSDHVLVTYKWGEDDYEVSELDYWVTKYEAENGNAQCKRLIDHVIAWRYMLAPYRGGDAE